MKHLVVLALICFVQPASVLAAKKTDQQARYSNLELFQKVLHFIETNYVDEVENTALVHGAIKGMMQTLDPHSNFLPPDVFKDMKIDTSGKFGGIGIEIGIRDNVLTVITPIEGTPAWKAGVQPGDRIVKINGESTKGLSLVEAVAKMRGKRGSKVHITIFRRGFDKSRDVKIVRDTIRIRAVPQAKNLEPGFAYIRLQTFNENAARDVRRAIKRLEKKGRFRGLILDLRTNPGGLLDQAVDVSSIFLNEGVIVSTIGRNRDQKEVKHAKRGKARKDFPMAILVSSATASAAEIVAGALQDHKRAVVMGQPTFGKGSVQTVIELGKTMGLKLTVARYYTPSGRSIQEQGVMPDILLDQFDSKLLEKAKVKRSLLREKDLPRHITGDGKKGPSHFTESELQELVDTGGESKKGANDEMKPLKVEPEKDYQVQQALNYLKSFQIFEKMTLKDQRT